MANSEGLVQVSPCTSGSTSLRRLLSCLADCFEYSSVASHPCCSFSFFLVVDVVDISTDSRRFERWTTDMLWMETVGHFVLNINFGYERSETGVFVESRD